MDTKIVPGRISSLTATNTSCSTPPRPLCVLNLELARSRHLQSNVQGWITDRGPSHHHHLLLLIFGNGSSGINCAFICVLKVDYNSERMDGRERETSPELDNKS